MKDTFVREINTSKTSVTVNEVRRALEETADWWLNNVLTHDETQFFGEISHVGVPKPDANKGIILTSRMLWFFSESAIDLRDDELALAAKKIYRFICHHFVDKEYGGVFWEVNRYGQLVNDRKQIYAQSFAIYAFCAYYKLTRDEFALRYALAIFKLIETYSYDEMNGGYVEAFSVSWGPLEDFRLSEKDLNAPKTMNTHLHILEAYTALYHVSQHADVEMALKRLVRCYLSRFFNSECGHFRMFLDHNWEDRSTGFSYGHDIESSWLIWEAVKELGEQNLVSKCQAIVLRLVEISAQQGLDEDGSVIDWFDFETSKNASERIWWVQAEGLVGFLNAYQMTKDKSYLVIFNHLWNFVKKEIIDEQHGEWHMLAKKNQHENYREYKVGFWKGPYHNGRALIELCRRLKLLQN